MTRPRFPKQKADGSFCIEVSCSVNTERCNDLARNIQHWWDAVWVPANDVWLRIWKTGPDLAIERPETLRYWEHFLAPPEVISCDQSALRFRLLGNNARDKLWKDWLASRIVPDLKTNFPEVGELLRIVNCE
jgi:hypothetical protein